MDTRRDPTGAYEYWPRLLGFAGDTLLFARLDAEHGVEPWRSDGTAAGTVLLGDLNPGPAWSSPTGGVAIGDRLAFFADDGVHGREPWISDGVDGAQLVLDVNPGAASSRERWDAAPLPIGDTAVFAAADAEHGRELWRTDGTAAGTVLVADIVPGAGSGSPLQFTVSGPRLFFAANDHVHGRELWALDLADLGCTAPCVAPTPTPARTPRPIWTSGPPRPTSTPTPTPTQRTVEDCRSGEQSGCAVLEIGSAAGEPGDAVDVGVDLTTGGLSIAGLELNMIFPEVLSLAADGCRANPQLDKQLFSGLPPGTDHGLHVLLLSLSNVDPIPSGPLFTCTFRIRADAAAGRHPIACEGFDASTPDGEALARESFVCAGGSVVGGGSDPDPTSTPSHTPASDDNEVVGGSAAGGCQGAGDARRGSALLLLPLVLLVLRIPRRRR